MKVYERVSALRTLKQLLVKREILSRQRYKFGGRNRGLSFILSWWSICSRFANLPEILLHFVRNFTVMNKKRHDFDNVSVNTIRDAVSKR